MWMGKRAPICEAPGSSYSRRRVLSWMLGATGCLAGKLEAGEAEAPVRLAISQTLVADVNLTDARAAMKLWLKRLMDDLKVTIEISPTTFDTTEDLLRRSRTGQLDAVALNVVEYRQIADLLDSSELLVGAGASGPDQYLLLVKRNSAVRQLADLRERRLSILTAPKMCVASAWLTALLDDAHLGSTETFFSSVTGNTKVPRVVLPVFFGQADACLTSKRGFDTMCELNPQVGKELTAIETSPSMVVAFYAFRKNYHNPSRRKFIDGHASLLGSPAGRQIAMLFQFDQLTVRDGSCLTNALSVLEKADRARSGAGRKGSG
jgi:ABC-type phosphate/phosphonate transport system substrate-binding protein